MSLQLEQNSLVHPVVRKSAAYAWRLLVIGVTVAAALWLLGLLLAVVIPVMVAIIAARGLWPLRRTLTSKGVGRGLAAALTLAALILVTFGSLTLAGALVATEMGDLSTTASEGLDDVSDWLVNSSPIDVTRGDIDRWRSEMGNVIGDFLSSNSDAVVANTVLAGEILIGTLLALIVTFFLLKDGDRFVATTLRWVPTERREVTGRAAGRAWDALGGYLRGAVLLGTVEAAAVGGSVFLVGGQLVAAVMVVTFAAAFVPIVGAILAGVVAVLVTLVTAGPGAALIVAAVALVVQQVDNELLAPVVYGRQLQLHPLTILLGVTAFGAIAGVVGVIFAVPVIAVAINAFDEFRQPPEDDEPAPDVTVEV